MMRKEEAREKAHALLAEFEAVVGDITRHPETYTKGDKLNADRLRGELYEALPQFPMREYQAAISKVASLVRTLDKQPAPRA